MIPKEAIELSIKGGWQGIALEDMFSREYYIQNWQEVALDPSFWGCLGKELGWEETICPTHLRQDRCGIVWRSAFKVQAHRLFDLILTKQDTKAFWNDLLAQMK